MLVVSLLSGCNNTDKEGSSSSGYSSPKSSSDTSTDSGQQLIVDENGNIIDTVTGETVSDPELSVDENGNIINKSGSVITQSSQNQQTGSKITSSGTAGTSSGSGSSKGSSSNKNSSGSSTGSTSSKGSGSSSNNNSSSSQVKPSSDEDIDWIANRVLTLLNEERQKLGVHKRTMPSGLKKVAQYRSKQLVTYFSHYWIDEEGNKVSGDSYVCNLLKYGERVEQEISYLDENFNVVYTGEIEVAYVGIGAENCSGGGGNTKEEIAQSFIDSFKSSSGHWRSLMSDEQFFDGIGISYGANSDYPGVMWWCSVNSSAKNYG